MQKVFEESKKKKKKNAANNESSKIAGSKIDPVSTNTPGQDINTSWNSGSRNCSHVKFGAINSSDSKRRGNDRNRNIIWFNPTFRKITKIDRENTPKTFCISISIWTTSYVNFLM